MRFAALAALALFVLGAAPALAQKADGPVIRRGIVAEPATLDPQKASTFTEAAILTDLFEGLTTFDALGRLAPGAAESWTVSEDGTVYTFKLRQGLRWSNNERLRAADFVASFRRLFEADTAAADVSSLLVIKNADLVRRGRAKAEELGVAAVDPTTLEITLESPTPTFLLRLAEPAAMPIHAATVKKFGAEFSEPGKLVSNGPFRLQSRLKDGTVVLLRNTRYCAAAAVAPVSVLYRPFENAAACADAFRKSEVVACADVPVEDLSAVKSEFGPALHIAPYLGTYYYVFDTRHGAFADVRVRRALAIAIDQTALAETAWQGGMLPATSLIPSVLIDLPPRKPIAERRTEAKRLLEEAGYGPAKPLSFTIRVGTGKEHEATAAAVAAQWKEIGVTASVVTEANRAHFERLSDGGQFDVARSGWIAEEADPLAMLDVFHGANEAFNHARWKDQAFDGLLDLAAGEINSSRRTALLTEAEATLEEAAPLVPLFHYASLSLVSPKLGGWHDTITNLHPSRFLRLEESAAQPSP